MIRDILSRHDRVALHLAIITIGDDVHILTLMADMNLEKFLLFQLHQYGITELLQEAANLANALDYLHNRLQAGDQVYFYHRDLKPSKILIYSTPLPRNIIGWGDGKSRISIFLLSRNQKAI